LAEFFTSDTHHSSAKVIAKSGRPFASAEEMDGVLLDRINKTVGRDDTLYHLGDFSNAPVEQAIAFRKAIRCRNVYLVAGNHDEHTRKFKEFRKLFVKVKDILEIRRSRRLIVMCHYPIRLWHHWDKGSILLSGHAHQVLKPVSDIHLTLDVGVDGHEFRPWSYAEVMEYMAPRIEKYDRTEITSDLF
jgi:calcineurin-like phosphoesterase family protein